MSLWPWNRPSIFHRVCPCRHNTSLTEWSWLRALAPADLALAPAGPAPTPASPGPPASPGAPADAGEPAGSGATPAPEASEDARPVPSWPTVGTFLPRCEPAQPA